MDRIDVVDVANKSTAWLLSRRETIFRRMYLAQAPVGLLLLALAVFIGHDHFRLLTGGQRTQGTIVRYVEQTMPTGSGARWDIAFMPVVRYQAGGRTVEFQDWMGTASRAGIGNRVPVLYDPQKPATAMIDRPTYNWIPWAPIFVLGAFLVLVAIKGWLKYMSSQP